MREFDYTECERYDEKRSHYRRAANAFQSGNQLCMSTDGIVYKKPLPEGQTKYNEILLPKADTLMTKLTDGIYISNALVYILSKYTNKKNTAFLALSDMIQRHKSNKTQLSAITKSLKKYQVSKPLCEHLLTFLKRLEDNCTRMYIYLDVAMETHGIKCIANLLQEKYPDDATANRYMFAYLSDLYEEFTCENQDKISGKANFTRQFHEYAHNQVLELTNANNIDIAALIKEQATKDYEANAQARKKEERKQQLRAKHKAANRLSEITTQIYQGLSKREGNDIVSKDASEHIVREFLYNDKYYGNSRVFIAVVTDKDIKFVTKAKRLSQTFDNAQLFSYCYRNDKAEVNALRDKFQEKYPDGKGFVFVKELHKSGIDVKRLKEIQDAIDDEEKQEQKADSMTLGEERYRGPYVNNNYNSVVLTEWNRKAILKIEHYRHHNKGVVWGVWRKMCFKSKRPLYAHVSISDQNTYVIEDETINPALFNTQKEAEECAAMMNAFYEKRGQNMHFEATVFNEHTEYRYANLTILVQPKFYEFAGKIVRNYMNIIADNLLEGKDPRNVFATCYSQTQMHDLIHSRKSIQFLMLVDVLERNTCLFVNKTGKDAYVANFAGKQFDDFTKDACISNRIGNIIYGDERSMGEMQRLAKSFAAAFMDKYIIKIIDLSFDDADKKYKYTVIDV